jgi:hypothetical protein
LQPLALDGREPADIEILDDTMGIPLASIELVESVGHSGGNPGLIISR